MASKAERAMREAIIGVLQQEGIEYTEGYSSRHPYVEFTINGRRHKQHYGTSPSDPNAPSLAARDTRHAIQRCRGERP